MANRDILFSIATAGSVLLLGATGVMAAGPDKVQVGAEPKAFPESMTSTQDGTLYAGSIDYGTILKAAPGAAVAETWIDKPDDGPQSVLGVLADEASGTLWACYSNFGIKDGPPAVLASFDLASGAPKGSYAFPAGSFCNDIATTSDGTAYAADTSGARIMRLAPGGSELEEWLKDDRLAGADGIATAPDGQLYVNSISASKLYRVGIEDKTLTEIATSVPVNKPDGMRFGPDGTLYVAENGGGMVSALSIDGDKATVKPLEGSWDTPTAVSLVGDTLWVLEAKLGMRKSGEESGAVLYVSGELPSTDGLAAAPTAWRRASVGA